MHCRPAKPIEDDLASFISGEEGFIVFAIGGVQKMEDMPTYMQQYFIDVFAALPQRVIWQWKGKMRPDLPPNVRAMAWLPQQDLLGKQITRQNTHLG